MYQVHVSDLSLALEVIFGHPSSAPLICIRIPEEFLIIPQFQNLFLKEKREGIYVSPSMVVSDEASEGASRRVGSELLWMKAKSLLQHCPAKVDVNAISVMGRQRSTFQCR